VATCWRWRTQPSETRPSRRSGTARRRQALVFNQLAGKDLLAAANAAIGDASLKTVGDCAAAGDDLEPCRSVPGFPVHKQGKDWKITVPYATGLDTFSMTNISMRCDPTSAAAPAKLGWFAELDGTIRDLGINVTAHVDFPKLKKTALKHVANLTAHIVARVNCVNGTSLQLELDPAEGSLTLSKVEIDISIIHVDVSSEIVQALRTKLQSATFTPPERYAPMLRAACAGPPPEPELQSVLSLTSTRASSAHSRNTLSFSRGMASRARPRMR